MTPVPARTHPRWVASLPAAVQAAAAAPGHPLGRILERVELVGERLGLGEVERAVVGYLLAQDIDDELRGPTDASVQRRACTRADVVMAIVGDQEATLDALVQLETIGAVTEHEEIDCAWSAQPISIARVIRTECFRRSRPLPALAPFALLPRLDGAIDDALEVHKEVGPARLHVVIRGRPGTGRDTVLATLLARAKRTALTRTAHDLRRDQDRLELMVTGSAAVWDGRGGSVEPGDRALVATFLGASRTLCCTLLDPDEDAPLVAGRVMVVLDTDVASPSERGHVWELALAARVPTPMRTEVVSALADRARAGIGLAHTVAAAARKPDAPTAGSWVRAILPRLEAALQPTTLRGVTVEHPRCTLESVVVPPPTSERIGQLVQMMRHSAELATPTRRGVKALLSGPSGTGKTLTARALASELDRPLFRVDLATVVSKWVGETEKNLRHAMQAAETAGALLLFDEGDALFGTRGEVSRGADRYANMEVSYLLQALELFDGLVVVTTNLRTNVDQAFLRRFDVTVDFVRPDASGRERLWRQELGLDTSRISASLLGQIVAEVELSGGLIAVVCRAARSMAFAGTQRMDDDILVRALASELRARGSGVAASRWAEGLRGWQNAAEARDRG